MSFINLNGGNDIFYGTAGADIVAGGTGNDFIDTGDGNDTIQIAVTPGQDDIRGGGGYDKLVVLDGNSNVQITFNTFREIEEIQGGNLSDTKIVGTANDDLIDMRGIVISRVQWIIGDGGNDTIYGTSGADTIIGAAGNDTINSGDGDDKITFYQSAGTDAVDGGGGYDTLVAASDYAIIGISSINNIEAIATSNANVGLAFTDSADQFDLSGIAVSGISFIDLKGGDDYFIGSSGADRIIGGLGKDYMVGGGGADIFDFNSVAESGVSLFDTIGDFVSGADKIDLSGIDARTNVNGDQGFTFIGTAAYGGVSGQLRYETLPNGIVMLGGDVNGDGVSDFNIAVAGGVTALTSSDFFL